MQELEKILEEIDKEAICISSYYVSEKYRDKEDLYVPLSDAKNIIHKHVNDGWISVEKYGFPQSNNHDFRFWITIQYDNGYRKTIKGKWDYFDKCFVYQNGRKVSENVVAYKYYSMPEPYQPERSENEI